MHIFVNESIFILCAVVSLRLFRFVWPRKMHQKAPLAKHPYTVEPANLSHFDGCLFHLAAFESSSSSIKQLPVMRGTQCKYRAAFWAKVANKSNEFPIARRWRCPNRRATLVCLSPSLLRLIERKNRSNWVISSYRTVRSRNIRVIMEAANNWQPAG